MFPYEIKPTNTQQAGRPHHVEERLGQRSRSNSVEQLKIVSEKRDNIISERRERISKRFERIHRNVEEKKQQGASSRSQASQSIAESMEQAEKNRLQMLQDRESKLAKHVQRVKTAGHRTNQARSKLIAEKKQRMVERQISTDLRRQALMKIPRSKLLDETVVEAEISRYRIATVKIQKWWRLQLLQRSIAQFKRTGLFGEEVKKAPFERLAPLLQDKRIIQLTSQLLSNLKKMTPAGRSRRYRNPTRIFLSAFLIVLHTQEIMPDESELQQAVKKAATAMLESFDKMVTGNHEIIAEFIELWHAYHTMFEEWKAADTEKMLNYMYDHFMQLEELRESVQSEPGANAEWNPQIDQQQAMIKEKVLRLGGKSAFSRFMAGQKEFRDMSDASDAEVMQEKRRRHDSVMNSKYASTSTSAPSSPAPQRPQKQVGLNDVLQEFGGIMTNERMAHELIMNPDFELTVDPQSLEAQIRNVAKKAFFDRLRADMEKSDFSWVTGVISDIKSQLKEMLPEKSKVRKEIEEVMDAEHIQQQVDRNVFDFAPYVEFVTSKMLQLCAPIRDAAIREIASQEDVLMQIETILTILDQMKLDLANFKMRTLRPTLMTQAVEYERAKFKEALENKLVSLDMTKKWLTDAVKKVETKVAARNPENIEHPENRVRYDEVYFDALMTLLFSPEANNDAVLAETLSMDVERLMMFQNEIQAISVVAALIMLTKNFVADLRDDTNEANKLKKNLFLLLQEPHTTAQHLALHISGAMNEFLGKKGRSLTAEQETMITNMVEKTLTFKDTVYMLLNRRIAQRVRSHLTNGRIRNDSNNGLDSVQSEVDEISNKVFMFAKYNREVFAPWYDEIISNMA